jgi:glycosyltransferase involved in cell wall biosynthesis
MTREVVFFGTATSFGYHRVGGTDSFLRRLIDGVSDRSDAVAHGVFYGSEDPTVVRPVGDSELHYVESLADGLELLDDWSDADVVTTRLHPADRLRFARYRRRTRRHAYHSVEFFHPESAVFRNVKFVQHRILPYDGRVFCVSRRLRRVVERYADGVVYLPPPVDSAYFRDPSEKPRDEPISLTFVGRIDPRKGINEVVDLYREAAGEDRFEFAIHGTYISNDSAGVEIRNRLRRDPDIAYTEVDRHAHTPQVDAEVRSLMRETDVFLQPYRTLDSTVDTPLLLLESMASLCAVLTRPVGNVGDVYGESEFLLSAGQTTERASALLSTLDRETVAAERDRIHERVTSMAFDTASVVETFLHALETND